MGHTQMSSALFLVRTVSHEQSTPVPRMTPSFSRIEVCPAQVRADRRCPGLHLYTRRCSDLGVSEVLRAPWQDKEHALAVGHTQMSSADIIAQNKGAFPPCISYANVPLHFL